MFVSGQTIRCYEQTDSFVLNEQTTVFFGTEQTVACCYEFEERNIHHDGANDDV